MNPAFLALGAAYTQKIGGGGYIIRKRLKYSVDVPASSAVPQVGRDIPRAQ